MPIFVCTLILNTNLIAAEPPAEFSQQQPRRQHAAAAAAAPAQDEDSDTYPDSDSDEEAMEDKKPSAKKPPPAKKKPQRPKMDPMAKMEAEMERMTMNEPVKDFSFEVLHPVLVKDTSILSGSRRAHSIIDVFVYPCHETYYKVSVGSDSQSIELSTRIPDDFIHVFRIENEVATAPPNEAELSQAGLLAHNAVTRAIRHEYQEDDIIWSSPPQVIKLKHKIENTISDKVIMWQPGCYELIDYFQEGGNQHPPQYAVLR